MSRRKMTPEEATDALVFHIQVTSRGCQLHDDEDECEEPIQAAHIIPKQTLRRHGHEDKLWDPRNGLGACYKAHRRSDGAVERFPVERIPSEAWEYAREVDLEWWLERVYGKEPTREIG